MPISHNFGVRLLWARGRNSLLVAERVGTTNNFTATSRSCEVVPGCCSLPQLQLQALQSDPLTFCCSKSEPGSPHLITKELWERTGQGGNCDYFDKGISMLSQSKSPLMVVIERCISLHWWFLSLENCFSAWNITRFLPSPTPNEQVWSFILCQAYNLLLFPQGSPLSQVFHRQWFDSLSNVYINKICQSNPIWGLRDCLASLWSPNTRNAIPSPQHRSRQTETSLSCSQSRPISFNNLHSLKKSNQIE